MILSGTLTCVAGNPGHDSSVTTLVVSSDGRWVATASGASTIILWDARDAYISQEWFSPGGVVSDLAFSPDSRHLASASEDGKVTIWDISGNSRQVASLEGHLSVIRSCAWSSNGAYIASQARDRSVRLRDGRTFQPLPLIPDMTGSRPLFSPDSHWLLVPKGSGMICIWDMATKQECLLLKSYEGSIYDMAFSPDGRLLLSASWNDNSLEVWNTHTGAMVQSLDEHTRAVVKVCFSPCGQYIASASTDKTVKVWRTSDGSCLATVIGSGMLHSLPMG
ncbi:WD40 repeat-like protein [Dichomitus squalens LYAD-421 SS1]|uniref:WD40 repeat-like protein n=1 Tax=Dichomitus squalens (strain LYAD-421) TaxID=732165 RepID=R7SMB2_DICSQ|nr:WD40 repeat-like protein [Dichomitus squalens LYAD-421 SS1]EJF57294.1 WD40 repeat-like protein [Dichomitus squalens LYAD-421 SS1]